MTAQSRRCKHDPDDPAEILRALPEPFHAQFRAEHAVAVEQVRRPEQYRMLHDLLRLWRPHGRRHTSRTGHRRLASSVTCHVVFGGAAVQ